MPQFVALLRGVNVGTANRIPMHAADIAAAVLRELTVDVNVVVKSASEVANIVAENPIEMQPAGHPRLLVVFIQEPRALSTLASVEQLLVTGEAPLGKIGKTVTSRNWATTLKLQALASGGDGDTGTSPDI